MLPSGSRLEEHMGRRQLFAAIIFRIIWSWMSRYWPCADGATVKVIEAGKMVLLGNPNSPGRAETGSENVESCQGITPRFANSAGLKRAGKFGS